MSDLENVTASFAIITKGNMKINCTMSDANIYSLFMNAQCLAFNFTELYSVAFFA